MGARRWGYRMLRLEGVSDAPILTACLLAYRNPVLAGRLTMNFLDRAILVYSIRVVHGINKIVVAKMEIQDVRTILAMLTSIGIVLHL